MTKKKLIIIPIFLLVAGGIFFFSRRQSSSSPSSSQSASLYLYVSSRCPHCRKVEEWLSAQPEIKEKISLKVVDKNQAAARELLVKGEECQLSRQLLGAVPLLYDQGKCTLGDKPIIDYLKDKYQK
ncbi:hypothetical protein J7J95_00805 [bacterium]|nr:hypothetical protein [bacterium]